MKELLCFLQQSLLYHLFTPKVQLSTQPRPVGCQEDTAGVPLHGARQRLQRGDGHRGWGGRGEEENLQRSREALIATPRLH